MSKQPEARPKHDTARLGSCPGRPSPINQDVPRLPAAPVGRLGPARQKTAGTGPTRCRGARHKARPPPIPSQTPSVPLPHDFSCSAPLDLSPLDSLIRGPPVAPSLPRRRHCWTFVTSDIGGSPTLLPCGSPLSGCPSVPPQSGNP
jgi:hypothetical protein